MLKVLMYILIGACVQVVATDWWEHSQLYQIYPRSYKDTNGDGIGDLRGIIENLDHLSDAGVDGVWLSPIFASPMVDFGYDISDYEQIHPDYGTMEDFEALVQKCKSLGIKLLLDFVPNHTSDEHKWFQNSVNRVEGYDDYYIWDDGKVDPNDNTKKIPINNWNSVFYGSAWEWNEVRQQFYLHQFDKRQPDLNYRNEDVVQKMKDVLVYWMNKGVDGFRVDAVPFLFEKEGFPSEPVSGTTTDSQDFNYLLHEHTQDQPETYDMITQWRAVLDDYTATNGGDTRFIMVEAYTSPENLVHYYGTEARPGAHFPFNFNFITRVNKNSKAADFVDAVDDFLKRLPFGKFTGANWVIGNHDQSRVASRYGTERLDGIAMIIMLLPGVGITYQGDEIGMTDRHLTWEQTKDPQACNANEETYEKLSRDPCRSPFQWDNTKNSGFSTADETWLPVSENFTTVNLAAEKAAARSHYKTFQAISRLRKSDKVFADGTLLTKAIQPDVFAFRRSLQGSPTYVVVINLTDHSRTVSLRSLGTDLPPLLTVVITSTATFHTQGHTEETRNVVLGPHEALVLKTN